MLHICASNCTPSSEFTSLQRHDFYTNHLFSVGYGPAATSCPLAPRLPLLSAANAPPGIADSVSRKQISADRTEY